jgi:hypothetical protein
MQNRLVLVRVSDIRSESAALAVGGFMAYRGFCSWRDDNSFVCTSSTSAKELKKSLKDEIQKLFLLDLGMKVVSFENQSNEKPEQ